jgi:HD-like signal output (HDOD) protein
MQATELVQEVNRLFSLPEVCCRLQEMLESPHHTSRELGKVIGQDPDLTARLLKIVNSSFYGYAGRIDTVNRAVTVIGISELLVLILGASSVMTFNKIPGSLINMADFWRHSVYCGVVARQLAKHCHVLHHERLFVAGLLHDVGKLILCVKLPEQMRGVLAQSYDSETPSYEIERNTFGFDHAELGGLLLKNWHLPESLCESVSYHHQPSAASSPSIEAAIVHIANAITHIAENETSDCYFMDRIEKNAWALTRLDKKIADKVLADAMPLFDDALDAIMPARH